MYYIRKIGQLSVKRDNQLKNINLKKVVCTVPAVKNKNVSSKQRFLLGLNVTHFFQPTPTSIKTMRTVTNNHLFNHHSSSRSMSTYSETIRTHPFNECKNNQRNIRFQNAITQHEGHKEWKWWVICERATETGWSWPLGGWRRRLRTNCSSKVCPRSFLDDRKWLSLRFKSSPAQFENSRKTFELLAWQGRGRNSVSSNSWGQFPELGFEPSKT
jgi:hypothetical protein